MAIEEGAELGGCFWLLKKIFWMHRIVAGPQPLVSEKHLLRGCGGPSSASTGGIQLNSLPQLLLPKTH